MPHAAIEDEARAGSEIQTEETLAGDQVDAVRLVDPSRTGRLYLFFSLVFVPI